MTCPKRRFDVRYRSVFGRMLLLRVHVTLETNESGLFIWKMCDGTHTAEAIAEALAGEYEIPLDEAREDVTAFLTRLEEVQFIAV